MTFQTNDGASIFTPAHLQTICEAEKASLVLGHAGGALSKFSYIELCKLEPHSDVGAIACAPLVDGTAAAAACACTWQSLSLAEAFYSAHTRPNGSRSCPLLTSDDITAGKATLIVNQAMYCIDREFEATQDSTRTGSTFKLGER